MKKPRKRRKNPADHFRLSEIEKTQLDARFVNAALCLVEAFLGNSYVFDPSLIESPDGLRNRKADIAELERIHNLDSEVRS